MVWLRIQKKPRWLLRASVAYAITFRPPGPFGPLLEPQYQVGAWPDRPDLPLVGGLAIASGAAPLGCLKVRANTAPCIEPRSTESNFHLSVLHYTPSAVGANLCCLQLCCIRQWLLRQAGGGVVQLWPTVRLTGWGRTRWVGSTATCRGRRSPPLGGRPSWSMMRWMAMMPSMSASGRGGQPGT